MVRAFLPQTHHGNILFNTDFPPQSDRQQGFIPVPEAMLYNNNPDPPIMEFNNSIPSEKNMDYNDN